MSVWSEIHLCQTQLHTMSAGNNGLSEAYILELASDIANQLNRSVTNQVLARQVVSFAERLPDSKSFVQACKAFGKFDESFLLEVYKKVQGVKKASVIKEEFKDEKDNISTLAGVSQKGGIIIPVKREKSPSSDGYPETKSRYGLDRLAKKIKHENEEKINLEDEKKIKVEYSSLKRVEDKKISFRKMGNVSTHTRRERPEVSSEQSNGLSKLSSSAREKLEAIRAKRNSSMTPEPRRSETPKPEWNQRSKSRRPDNRDTRREREEEISNIPGNDEFDGESQAALDRDWYLGDEFGHTVGDDSHNPFGEGLYDEGQEEQLRQKMNTRMSNIARQKQKEADMWEQNQMVTSGVKQQGYVDTDFTDENENRIHLFVHNLRPPFLDGQQVFTRQRDPISAVRDPQSDMAVFAKKGSALVRERRQKRERQKQAREAASMAGTTLGNVLGVKEANEEEEQAEAAESSNKFADHLKKQEGSSEFSKSLTVKEQRQFLPAFAVREELLKVIRDNQGKLELLFYFFFFFFFFI